MNSSCGTESETLSKAEVSEELSDEQLLEKFNIQNCSVNLHRLNPDEYDAAAMESSSQQPNLPRGPISIAPRYTYIESGEDIIIVREIPFLTLDDENASWKKGLNLGEKIGIHEHLNRCPGPDSDSESEEEGNKAKRKSSSQHYSNNRSNRSAKNFKKNGENIVKNVKAQSGILKKQDKRPKKNNQNTAVRAINDTNRERKKIMKERDIDRVNHRNMIKNQSSHTKTSQIRVIDRNNQTDSKVLKRKGSEPLKRQRKLYKRSVQNRALNYRDPIIEKDNDHILREKYGIKKCYVNMSHTPEVLRLLQPKSFTAHYGHHFLKEIAREAYSEFGINIDYESLYKKARLSQFSNLSRKAFKHAIWKFVSCMYKSDLFIEERIQITSKHATKVNKLVTKRKMWFKNMDDEPDYVLIKDRHVLRRQTRTILRKLKYPLVLVERSEEAAFLARKLAQQNKLDHEKYQQPNCSSYKECHGEMESNHAQFKFPLKMSEKLQDLNEDGKENHTGKQPLIFDSQQDIETEPMQNDDNEGSTCVSSKPCESLQYRLPVKCAQTAVTEIDCIPFQLTDNNEHTDIRNAQKKVTCVSLECNPLSLNREIPLIMKHNDDPIENKTFVAANECNPPSLSKEIPLCMEHVDDAGENLSFGTTNECNPPSLSREIPLSMEHIVNASENSSLAAANECNPPTLSRGSPLCMEYFDDANENKSCNAANEEFFVIDEDDSDSDSEKNSCVSCSEECSGADQQL